MYTTRSLAALLHVTWACGLNALGPGVCLLTWALLKVEGTCVGSGGCCCWQSAHHSRLLVTAWSNLQAHARAGRAEQGRQSRAGTGSMQEHQ